MSNSSVCEHAGHSLGGALAHLAAYDVPASINVRSGERAVGLLMLTSSMPQHIIDGQRAAWHCHVMCAHAGHSLGGALAQLAAYDLATAIRASGLDVRLACYTCGAPRLGNTSFARAYEAAVPDTWSIINDQVRRADAQLWNLMQSHVQV